MVRSRLNRIRSKRDTTMAMVYLVLAGVLVVTLVLWGVPWMAKTAGLLLTKDTGVIEVSELRPTPPIFSDVPEASAENKVSLGGFAQPGVDVILYVNGVEWKRSLTDDAGVFQFDQVELATGDNRIYAYAVTQRGSESEQSKEYYVRYDNEPPEITISSPEDGAVMRGQGQHLVTFQGIVGEEGTRVTVGERLAIVQSDGAFTVTYPLVEGDQEVIVKAIDRAGNETEKIFKLRWEK